MDSQTYIEYECNDPVSDRHLITESPEEATGYFEKGWTIYEHHITVTRASKYSTHVDVSAVWSDTPEIEEV